MHRIPIIRRTIVGDTSLLHGFAWTAVMIAILTLARWLLDRGHMGMPFAPYFPFILIAALLFGWRSGAFATVLSGVIANRLLRPEPVLFYLRWEDAVMVAFFFGSSALLIYIGELLRRLVRELDEAKAREQVFNAELLHRAKNTLAIVGALASLTRRRTSPEEFFPAFAGRIEALNRATDLLVREDPERGSLAKLIEHAIAPFRSEGNFRLEGPDCEIPQISCMPLMLVLHELSTNAVKHGALTAPDGVVAIAWEFRSEPVPVLALRWREHGGPPVTPSGHSGMGSTLMRAQKGLCGVEFRLPPAGAECDIEIADVRAL